MKKSQFLILIVSLMLFMSSIFAANLEESFPSPANSLGGQMTLNANAEINGTVGNTIVTTSWLNNGGSCDGASCVKSNTLAPTYAFTVDTGNGSDGWASANTTYSTDKQFIGVNLNGGDTLTLVGDITVKFQNNLNMSLNTKLIIDGHVTIHIPTFNQNMGSEVEIKSGASLTIRANDVNLDTLSVINPSDFTCLATNSIHINTGVTLKGLIYSGGTLILDNDVSLTGAATANQLTMNENSAIVYDMGALAPSSIPNIGGSPVCSATGGTDVLFLVDNSGSIDNAEYTSFANIIETIGTQLQAQNAETRLAVAHYAGTSRGNAFGQNIYFERDFSTSAITSPIRQFGAGGAFNSALDMDNMAGAVYQAAYGMDDDAGTTSAYIVSPLKELTRDLTRPLQIIIFTDARREIVGNSATIDGSGYAFEPNDGSNFTIYNKIKTQGVKFSVVSFSADTTDIETATAVASVGGSWNGNMESNLQDPEGSQTKPRRFENSATFSLNSTQIDNFVDAIGEVCPSPSGTIKGNVYKDENSNKSYDLGTEDGIGSIEVSLYDENGTTGDTSDDTLVGTTSTDTDGSYRFDNLDATLTYRIEVSETDPHLPAGFSIGTTNPLTNITVTAGGMTIDQNFGFDDGSGGGSTTCNPVVTSIMPSGSLSNNVGSSSVVAFDYDHRGSIGDFPTPTQVVSADEVGTVWGKAYDTNNKKLYVASFLRRHADLSPHGLGAIYAIDVSDVSSDASVGSPTLFMNVNNLTDLGGGATLFPSETAANRGLGTPFAPSHDVWAYSRVAKEGLGGMDISDDMTTLYTMDLTNRQLLEIDIASKTVSNRYPVNDPGCVGGISNVRPFGVDYINGEVYIGVTCSGETTKNDGDVNGYVMQLDGTSFTPVVSGVTGFTWTTYWSDDTYDFGASCSNLSASWGKLFNGYVPLITNIEIDQNGNMVIGVTSRNGFRFGEDNYHADASCSNYIDEHESRGFVLHATPSGSNWVLSSDETWNTSNGDEQHHYKDGIYAHWGSGVSETYIGGMAKTDCSGQEVILTNLMDPLDYETAGTRYIRTSDAQQETASSIGDVSIATSKGSTTELYSGMNTSWEKSSGLGDIEYLALPSTPPPPPPPATCSDGVAGGGKYAVGWWHNGFGSNTPKQDGYWKDHPISGTSYDIPVDLRDYSLISTAEDERYGSGVVATLDSTRLWVDGADTMTLEDAIAANDYVEYEFHTANFSGEKFISRYINTVNTATAGFPYKFAILVSDQVDFSSALTTVEDVLREDYSNSNPKWVSDPTNFAIPETMPTEFIKILPDTTYYIRVYIYDDQSTDARGVNFDDFNFALDDCGGADEGEPFTCSVESYLTTSVWNDSDLHKYDLTAGISTKVLDTYTTDNINAIGYNVNDNYLWGWDLTEAKVMRLDANGTVKLYDTTIPTDTNYTSGDVSKEGILYLAKPAYDHKIHKVDVNGSAPVYLGSIDLTNTSVHFGDFSINPIDGQLYSTYGNTLYRVDPTTGAVDNLGVVNGPTDYYFHSYVFDKMGNMYFYGPDNDGTVYKLDISDPSNINLNAESFSKFSNPTTNGDGARCVNAPVPEKPLQPIGCQSAAYLLNDTLDLYEHNMSSVASTQHANALVDYANGIGYNQADGFIWGYVNGDTTEQMLIKIGKDGSDNFASELVGPIVGTGGHPDLPLGTGASKAYINIGDVSEEGKLHLLYRENASLGLSSETDHLYVVDLNSSSANYLKVIDHTTISNGGNGLSIVDWAFHPLNGKLYALSTSFAEAATLFEIDPSAGYAVTTHNVTGLSKIDDTNYEAFFDDQGIFYGYAPSEGRVFRLDLSDPSNPAGVADVFALVGSGSGGDTARCAKAPLPTNPLNLVAEYRFDDCVAWLPAGGPVADSSGNALHGTTIGGVTQETGKINSGAYFDGVSYIQVADDPKLQLLDSMAISFWLKPIDPAYGASHPKQSLIVKGLGAEFKVELWYESNTSTLQTNYDHSTDGALQQSLDQMQYDQWYHGMIVRDKSTKHVTFYLNGMVTDPDHYNVEPTSNNQVLLIGAGDEANFKGVLDEVKIFEGFATPQNVLEIYTYENAGTNWDGTPRAAFSCTSPEEPFSCSDTLYLANQSHKGTGVSDGVMWLHTVNQNTAPYSYDAIGTTPYDDGSGTGSYNAIGYNVQDNFIYATDENRLLKLDANGTVRDLGAIAGLPASQLYAGEFDRDGFYYISGNGGASNIMYKIDVNSRAVVDTITLSSTVKFWDMAINQAGDKFYAMTVTDDANGSFDNDKVVEIDIATGAITTIGGNHKSMDSYISLVFSDVEDKLFMMSNEDGYYQVDKSTGKLYPIASTQDLTYLNDGAGCPDANLTQYPTVTINDVSKKEGDSGLTPFTFTVTLSEGAPANAGLWVTFTDGVDAVAPIETAGHVDTHTGHESDFSGTAHYIPIPTGATSFEINASVVGDLYMEHHEEFYVDLYAADNLLIMDNRGVGTIINDDVVLFRVERKDSDSFVPPTTAYEQQQKEAFYTQIVNRDFDYSVVSYDKNQTDHEEFDIEDITVKIELYDHNDTAPNNRLYTHYMYFEKGTPQSRKKVLDIADLQIQRASRDARFLVSCLLDGNGSIVYGNYATEVDFNNTKTAMGASESYGHSDNFAIRPANYRLRVQDTSAYGDRLYKVNNSSDTVTLASGYLYPLVALATMDGSDIKADRYTNLQAQELNVTLLFNDLGMILCDDSNDSDMIANSTFGGLFQDGELMGGSFVHHNVGNYTFHLEDINWTTVDQDSSGDPALDGCVRGSGTNTPDAKGRYGCNIATGEEANYDDIAMRFEPYEYNITNTGIVSIPSNKAYLYMGDINRSMEMGVILSADVIAQGMDGRKLTNYTVGCMANDVALDLNYLISTDRNMSFDLPSYDGIWTENGRRYDFKRVISYNYFALNTVPVDNNESNLSRLIPVPREKFLDVKKGETHLDILYNINKDLNHPMNPVRVTFSDLNATSIDSASSMKGLDSFVPFAKAGSGSFVGNHTKTFMYAKVAPYEENYGDVVGSSASTPIYVALYCGNMPQAWCDNMFAINPMDSSSGFAFGSGSFAQDGWYVARDHNSTPNQDGGVIAFVPDEPTTSVSPTVGNLPNFVDDPYVGRLETLRTETTHPLPWEARITVNLDPWLLHHPIRSNGQPFWRLNFTDGNQGTITGIGETGNVLDVGGDTRSSGKIDW